MSNSRNSTSAVARAIQERLAQAQSASTAPDTNTGTGALRITKDGTLLGPDDPTPPNTQVTAIPNATFHREEQ